MEKTLEGDKASWQNFRKLTVELAESGLKKIRQEANIEALAAERSDLEVSFANPGSFLINYHKQCCLNPDMIFVLFWFQI